MNPYPDGSDDPREVLLARVAAGGMSPEEALAELDALRVAELGFACIDHDRARRCGMPEVIFAASKTPEQVCAIAEEILRWSPCVLMTRVQPDAAASVYARWPDAERTDPPGTILIGTPPEPSGGEMLLVAAGTSDLPVAREAELSAKAMGCRTRVLTDVGVAGLHRLLRHRKILETADVIVAIAGMEGALPGVIGGLVRAPVIAVPTSVGYGAGLGGVAALMGMLTSCVSGMGVVNIDNGFGAAALAARILHVHAQEQKTGDPT